MSLPYIIKATNERRAEQNQDRLEPHMLFLPHDISRRMSEQLQKENSDIHMFVHQACVQYLNMVDNDQRDLDKWLALSEMQLSESNHWKGWSYNEEDEDIFKQPRVNSDEEGE